MWILWFWQAWIKGVGVGYVARVAGLAGIPNESNGRILGIGQRNPARTLSSQKHFTHSCACTAKKIAPAKAGERLLEVGGGGGASAAFVSFL